ncbi:MAG TPA: Yip1 family protein, partial [Ktedonobacterales bacterium]
MTWDPPQEPPGWQGPFTEYGAYGPATGPQMPPPGFGASQAGPYFNAPPLSLWEAIKQLPKQYWRILTKPGATTFAEEMGKARWDVIWAQILGLSLLSALLASLVWLILIAFLTSILNAQPVPPGEPAPSSFTGFLFLPIPLFAVAVFLFGLGGFFLGQGITYLLAKAFGGQGSFMVQAYTTLLFQVPIGICIALLSLIPLVGSVASLGSIYIYILQTFQVIAVHRLSTGKAVAVVLIPVAAGILLGIILAALYFF